MSQAIQRAPFPQDMETSPNRWCHASIGSGAVSEIGTTVTKEFLRFNLGDTTMHSRFLTISGGLKPVL